MSDETNNQKETKIKKRYLIILIAVIITVLAGVFLWHASHYQSTDDAYIESHMVRVAPRVAGQIVDVYIDDNQKVEEGDLVAKIDDTDYKVKLAQADANYQRALFNQEIAKANLSAKQSEIELAQTDLNRYKELYAAGAVSKQTLDSAQTKLDNVKASLETAEQGVFSKQQKNVSDADLKALKALRDQAELNLSYTKIKAPQAGVVTNKNLEKGMYVQTGQSLFVIVPQQVWIVANFKESQVGNMKPGQEVEIKIDAYKDKVFKGKVDSIQRASGAKSSLFPPENAVGSFVKIVQRIPVKIVFTEEIDPNVYNIVSGMSVVPKVKVK
ncbi:HlyD family secretion protein [bacterium]|nr:HlyD family secretion protein [bacterium]